MKNSDDITSSSSPNAIKIKSLLSSSTNMITTTEVTNKQFNLKKILYQSERERERDRERDMQLQQLHQIQHQTLLQSQLSASQNGNCINVDTLDDDEDRLVIDLNDEIEVKAIKPSLALIDSATTKRDSMKRSNISSNFRHENTQNDMPKIIYLTSDSENSNGSVKIDILTPVSRDRMEHTRNFMHNHRLPPPRRMTVDDRQLFNLNRAEKHLSELETINTEIDNLINYKSDLIIQLLQEYNNDRISASEFSKRMKNTCDITCSDLDRLTNNLTKKHHFQLNKDVGLLSKSKYLNFPTTATDLVGYFESVRQHLNKQQFLDTMKFYQIIIKELLNLNKTKIIQYLLEYLVVRKNSNADVLNLSCPKNVRKPLPEKLHHHQHVGSAFSRILPRPQPKKLENLSDSIFKQCDSNLFYINRTNLIYTQSKSQIHSNTKNVCITRPSFKEQKRQKHSPLLQSVSSSSPQQTATSTATSTSSSSSVGGLRINPKLLPSPVKNLTNKTVSSNTESDISPSSHRIVSNTNHPLPPVPYAYRYKPTLLPTTIVQSTQTSQHSGQHPQARIQQIPSPQSPPAQIPSLSTLYHPSTAISQQQEQQKQVSLQRKLHMKYKHKTPKYIEPIQNHHPYYYHPTVNPNYYYHPYYYSGFATSTHQLHEQPSSDNVQASSLYESPLQATYPYPYRYSYLYPNSVERPETPPSSASDHTQSELYYQLTLPLPRVPAPNHTQPIQPQPIYQAPLHSTHLAPVPYDSLPRSHHQVSNQASDYYKYYYSKNC